MSWDVLIQDFGDYKQIKEIPNDFQPKSIGNRNDIIAKIKATFPEVKITDPSWLVLENDKFSIEFNIGNEEIVDSIMLHIRGDESVINVVLELLTNLNVRAVDTTTGKFVETQENSKKGLNKWREFRNSLLKKQ